MRREHPDSFANTVVWLKPPPEIANALVAHRKHWWWLSHKHFPAAHRLHLSMHNLGPLDDEEIGQVSHILSGVRVKAFDLALTWSGVWTSKVAVACPQAHEGLTQLHAALARHLHGRLTRQSWSPHVTLAWNVPWAGAARLTPLHWPVREFLLVRSWHGEEARHEVLSRYQLEPLRPGACHAGRHTAAA
ncbi:2'-5' RNA ligase family protein [Xenophilus arseniciresistens]|uniref:2'-5' RNA ligase family protein n=1 Tax=Xenophilus arseniciresistens TaxID=1283306 RepID=A0AAE3N9H4_9BURK|nr:2'-5' RNA ligase family protein [Xenophilus arseniciresistens]MDA7417293.1 2'-5' RNA ligase family protein [Xenophilus arseniciresistens]